MSSSLSTIALCNEEDVVAARQRARQIAERLGFAVQDRTRIATAVSEIARDACGHAGGGTVEFMLEGERAPQLLVIRVVDQGPGVADPHRVLEGLDCATSGMRLGILAAKRLMDHLEIRSGACKGTEVVLTKILPASTPLLGGEDLESLAAMLAEIRPISVLQELEAQNRELIQALSDLRERQEELGRLNRELEDTNRGVVALYAELDERADHLRRADEMKTRFLSNMSHEFRTPLNSIRALSRLLLDRIDGPLTEEQTKQVVLIRRATDDLAAIVDDLLDIAKIAAGRTEASPSEFRVAELFGMLRGMLRPLLNDDTVALRFDDASALPPLYTDEAKLSQILRNLISNALKFTQRGEVRVSAALAEDGAAMRICVTDTGIGIAVQDQERIFDEFIQIAGPLQARVKGTGLGLPLSRRLAKLLGGTLEVSSTPGSGSTFCVTLPVRFGAPDDDVPSKPTASMQDPGRLRLLVVENDAATLREYEHMLQSTVFGVLPAHSIRQAHDLLIAARPAAIVLAGEWPGESGWTWLSELKRDQTLRHVPVLVAAYAHDPAKARALGADAFLPKPVVAATLLAQLDALLPERVLVIDDDATARYTVARFLGNAVPVLEAEDGVSGLRLAAKARPSLVVLDLQLPDINGGEVLKQLRASAGTRDIPVVIVTSMDLDDEAKAALASHRAVVLPKAAWDAEALSRAMGAARAALSFQRV